MKGRIADDDSPIVAVTLSIKSTLVRFDAVLDTGFEGYISVPRKYLVKGGWKKFGTKKYVLADGTRVRFTVYLGDVIFDGKRRTVLALATKSEDILLGTKLLSGQLCELDYKTRLLRIRKGGTIR